jgi:ring-1,2-phenylacetyl-CoA epoxidase subunit PaaC
MMTVQTDTPLEYLLHLADNVLILGHRLSEWCGHGPVLEQDIALTNISLDLVGQARMYYQYAAEIEGNGKTEDDLAYLRDVPEFRNFLLTEQPNGDWGQTIVRQFLFDAWHHPLLKALTESRDQRITDESNRRMNTALDMLWPYTGELFTDTPMDMAIHKKEIAPLPSSIHTQWMDTVTEVLNRATLTIPNNDWAQLGGKTGQWHTEHLGHILAEMQWMQRAYPNMQW